MNYYQIGNAVGLTGTFVAVATGLPIDPSTVACTLRDPQGAETTLSGDQITRVGPGAYSCVVTPDSPGFWQYRWSGSGNVAAAAETGFVVQQSAF